MWPVPCPRLPSRSRHGALVPCHAPLGNLGPLKEQLSSCAGLDAKQQVLHVLQVRAGDGVRVKARKPAGDGGREGQGAVWW